MPLQVKDKVEQLVPKSEELLSQTQRQERAISNIHNDLKEKTNAIMKELSDVERELLTTKTTSANVVKAEVEQQRASVPPRVVRGHVQRVQRPSVLMPLALPLIRDFNEDTESVEVTTYGNTNYYLHMFMHVLTFDFISAASTFALSSKETEDDEETTGITRGPSVVFPSIENKPIVANTTFSYQFGKNKSGVEVHTYIR